VTYETVYRWALKFGSAFAHKLKRVRPEPDDRPHLDEMFVSVNGKRMYPWRIVNGDGKVLDILVQSWRNQTAALKLMCKPLKNRGYVPIRIVTDKFRS